jgi:hypothetical protein
MAFTDKTWAFQEALESAEYNVVFRDNFRWVRQLTARTTADQTNSTTTMADATGVSFAIGASETFHLFLDCVLAVGGSEDAKTTWTVPAGATGRQWYHGGSLGDGSSAIGADLVLGSTGSADFVVQFGAVIVNSTNAGTCQWRFAQFAGGGVPVILRANAVLMAHRVA